MDEFNYLTVLISIILGLGITRLLKGLGQQIEYRTRITRYWPALCWALILLLIHVQSWWAMFGMREHRGWDFLTFAVVLLQPIVLYLLAALVLPTPGSGNTLDLREHYYAQSRWLFGLFVLLLLVSLVKTSMLTREAPRSADLLFHLVFIALSSTVAISRRPRVHEVVAATVAVLLGAYIALLFSQLR